MNINIKSDSMEFLDSLTDSAQTLGNLLESIRLCDEATQADFAKILGISRSHLCDIEKGRKLVSPKKALEYAETLGYLKPHFLRLALQDQIQALELAYKVNLDEIPQKKIKRKIQNNPTRSIKKRPRRA